jgi:oligopeptide transport system ATP-binding protein
MTDPPATPGAEEAPEEDEIAFEGARRKATLRAEGLSKLYPLHVGLLGRPRFVRAVDGVSVHLHRGETLGLIGESGCGKSTLGRLLVRLVEPTYGRIVYDGKDLLSLDERALRRMRRRMQIIVQEPGASLNPKLTVGRMVGDPLERAASAHEREASVAALLEKVGLDHDALGRRPHELSAGEKQRVAIARALATSPELVVCDDPTSALDVPSQARILDLLSDLSRERGVAHLFIAHDLHAVRRISHRVAVMLLGRIVETGGADDVLNRPAHPYMRALLSAAPLADPARRRLRVVFEGKAASPIEPPAGCAFHPRCPRAKKGVCDGEVPLLQEIEQGARHAVACYHPEGV